MKRHWLVFLLSAVACAPSMVQAGAPERANPAADASDLTPLWQSERGTPRHHVARVTTALAPLVTSSLPEDAAWEGFVTPASSANNLVFIEYQGKLVMQNNGIAGAVVSPYLTMWDGTSFEPLPMLSDAPTALGVWNDHLVVASTALSGRSAILMLDGAQWDTLGVANNMVETFAVFQSHLVAGGKFDSVSGVAAPLVAAYDGSTWTAAGTGLSGFEIKNLRLHSASLIAAGWMTTPTAVASLATLGGEWQAIGAGFTNTAGDAISYGGDLYVCGALGSSGGVAMGSFARWNGTSWTSLNPGSGSSDFRMTLWNGKIITSFRPGGPPGKLGQWDGISFTKVPGDSLGFQFGVFGGLVGRVGTWGTKLLASGSFVSNGSQPIPNIATYDGAQWGTIGVAWAPGMSGPTVWPIGDMLAWGGKLIVIGRFAVVADRDHWTAACGVAAWDGAHWSPVGGGLGGQQTVWLGTYGTDLIAGGGDMLAIGGGSGWVARWNGTSWSGLGASAPNWATSFAEFQGDLYVGSEAPAPDTTPSKWNGSTWSNVGGGTDGQVFALAQGGGRLVVGGDFTQAGTLPAAFVAFWDGASWQSAGAGVNARVLAATEWLGQPVIGGEFTASGATALPGVALWDGSAWQPMGTRAVLVQRLRVVDGELFATGDFKLPDDSIIEDTIAHWTGTDWKVLGSGGAGYAFEGYNGYLYQQGVGLVHGHPSHNLSRVPLSAVLDVPRPQPGPHVVALSVSPNPARTFARFSFTLPSAGRARVTVVDVTGRVVATLVDGRLDAGTHDVRWTAPAPAGIYFARLDTPGGQRQVVRVARLE